ncbi:hypothetical protein EVAR_23712_1 [Eumeta japonica]|uniref:Uncharacterized protein n=1 Tax=Eumeta variegata TaxID=151549 RepID=A0A4C1VID9_EUMVA|nr:hypothetical protein EVAR_23712_1 [Eumeta japonica]
MLRNCILASGQEGYSGVVAMKSKFRTKVIYYYLEPFIIRKGCSTCEEGRVCRLLHTNSGRKASNDAACLEAVACGGCKRCRDPIDGEISAGPTTPDGCLRTRSAHSASLRTPSNVFVEPSASHSCLLVRAAHPTGVRSSVFGGAERLRSLFILHKDGFAVENVCVVCSSVSRSSSQRVVLRAATRALAGRFRCEVSADAPSFHTEVRSAYIHVVGEYATLCI